MMNGDSHNYNLLFDNRRNYLLIMKKIVTQLSLFSIVVGILLPGTIIIEWKKNTEKDLAGYKIYWGIQPGRYSEV